MNFSLKAPSLASTLLVTAAACLLATGCSKKDKDKTATQVIASVDGEEISVHQMNTLLARAKGITPETLPQAKQEILAGLVEQQLAVNLAVSKKLDRTPEVVTEIENAKREILGRAALQQIAAAQPKPTDAEAEKYFNDHPALFAERRVFNLQEIAIRKNGQNVGDLEARVNSAKSMEEVASWLKENKVEFSANGGTRSAEQIPLEVLPKLHTFKDGQLGLIESKDAYLVMRLVASRSQPVTLEQATPTIKVFLANQRGTEAVKQERDLLKAKAKIEYFGEFAGGEAAFKAKAEAESKAAAEAKAAAQAKAKADADAFAQQKATEQATAQAEAEARSKARADARAQGDQGTNKPVAIDLEKGMKGLK
jgi:EpsD family peptidyl-prolyl cis-trans isomerase